MASLLSFSLPKPNLIKASSSATPTTTTTLPIPEGLDEKFGRKGIKFLESNNVPFVELTVRNGSSLRLRIPDAHVTSYKPKVYWKDDGFEEILYTVPAGGADPTKAKGGIGLVINEASEKSSKGSLLSGSEWTVKDADNDAIDALQVELSCSAGTLDISYVVSLYPLSIATAVIVRNNGRKDVSLTSAILSHLNFKKRGRTAINGLQGCSYCSHPPLSSPFELLSPSEAMKSESSGWFGSEIEEKPGVWTKQDVPITILKNKLSRVYAAPPSERLKSIYNTPPSKYETLDQNRELFFRIIRMGFEDIYLSSPGSLAEKYGKDYFICTGPASMLVPVVVKPGGKWKGAQVIEHDNFREFPVPSAASIPYQPINVDYLEGEFSGHGVTFEGIGDSCVAKMVLDNGSTVTLMLPTGLITSYKAPMWHGGSVELLHTSVSEGDEGEAVIQGGVSLALNCEGDNEVSWSPSYWDLHNIRGNSKDSIKVELISRDSENMVETRHIVTLQEDVLSSEILVSNSKSSPLQWTGSIMSHLTVSSPEATYALGLEGSNFLSIPPFLSNFGIIPPDFDQENDSYIGQLWSQMGFKRLFSGLGQRNLKNDTEAERNQRESLEEMEGEEEDGYKQLNEEMSRIYTSAPRFFTVIDRGRRNSVVVGRDGFDEVYMFSPGSSHEIYGEYAYICIGQSAMLKPIILGPGEVWRGCQYLHNPNM
ncbi:hypothetical protein REPUB_Repub06bG0029200 [Reevesia pubescens]